MELLSEIFDFQTLIVKLVRLKTEVSRCIDWVDLGLGPAGLGSRACSEKVALVEPKSSPIVNISLSILLMQANPTCLLWPILT